MNRAMFWGLFAAVFLAAAGPAWAGTLDDFEKQAADPANASEEDDPEECADDESVVGDLFGDLFFEPLLYGGAGSYLRASGQEDARETGEPSIPFARLDMTVQNVRSDVTAVDWRAETGYGPFAVEFRRTQYTEKVPHDTLSLTRFNFLYRMTFSRYVEWDLGAGSIALDGNQRHEGTALTMPVHVFVNKALAVEFRPTWGWIAGVPIKDHDLSALWTPARGVSVKAGYRWVGTGSAHLDGPYVGLSLHW